MTITREDLEHAAKHGGGMKYNTCDLAKHALSLQTKLDELLEGRENRTAADLAQEGGKWLAAARNWLQWHTLNDESVTWGSNDEIRPPFTVAKIEDLAATVAAAAMAPQSTTKRANASLLARWKAESERDDAHAFIRRIRSFVDRHGTKDLMIVLDSSPIGCIGCVGGDYSKDGKR